MISPLQCSLTRPLFLERSNSSCYQGAYNQGHDNLALVDLFDCCHAGTNICLGMGTDGAPSCSRHKFAVGQLVSEHNASIGSSSSSQSHHAKRGYAMLIALTCIAHGFHRDIEHTGNTSALIPRLHATAFVLSLSDVSTAFFLKLQVLIDNDLQWGFFPYCAPYNQRAVDVSAIFADYFLPAIFGKDHPDLSWMQEEWKCLVNGNIAGYQCI